VALSSATLVPSPNVATLRDEAPEHGLGEVTHGQDLLCCCTSAFTTTTSALAPALGLGLRCRRSRSHSIRPFGPSRCKSAMPIHSASLLISDLVEVLSVFPIEDKVGILHPEESSHSFAVFADSAHHAKGQKVDHLFVGRLKNFLDLSDAGTSK